MLIAVTDLSSYVYCPRALFLKKKEGAVTAPSKAMILGSLMHAAKQAIVEKNELAILSIPKRADASQIFLSFSRAYKTAIVEVINKRKNQLSKFSIVPAEAFTYVWPEISQTLAEKSQKALKISTENNVWGQDLWKSLLPKEYAEKSVSSQKLGLRGIIDRVDSYPDKEYIYEEKTGKPPTKGVWPAHRVQISAYQMIIKDITSKRVQGFVLYSGDEREVILNPFIEENVLEIRAKVEELLKGNAPEACSRPGKCDVCTAEIQRNL